jgi:hypothetical protein
MPLQRVHKRTRFSVPDFACSIVRSCDKLIAILIESTVGERQNVSLEFTEQTELLLFFFINFANEF